MLDISDIRRVQFDVLIIGAGGAGLSAAISASQDSKTRVGLVCKSLLGKAHTVMAEGGMAAALGNVDNRDDWKIHFRDTMRGGKMLNNWKMAEIHPNPRLAQGILHLKPPKPAAPARFRTKFSHFRASNHYVLN